MLRVGCLDEVVCVTESGLALQSDPKMIAGRVEQIEFRAEVALGRLNGLVAERELDLLERRQAGAGELGERAAQVVRPRGRA